MKTNEEVIKDPIAQHHVQSKRRTIKKKKSKLFF